MKKFLSTFDPIPVSSPSEWLEKQKNSHIQGEIKERKII